MAIFSKLVTTEKGLALIAKMLASENKIVFTRVCTSDTEYTLEELESMEELMGTKQTSSVSKVSRTSDIAVKVEAVFTNTELTEGYYMRTVALYAQDGNGGEILYAAAVETSGNCYMPAFGGVTVSGAYIQLVTTVSNAENVTVEVDNSVFATIGNIKDLQEQIDAVRGLTDSMATAVNVHAAKFERLDKIGSRVITREIREAIQCTHSNVFDVCSFSCEDLGADDDQIYYLYVLKGNLETTDFHTDPAGVYEGTIYVNMSLGYNTVGSALGTWVPIVRGVAGAYTSTPVTLLIIGGPPSKFNGLSIKIQPFLYKQNENKAPVDFEGTFNLHTSYMELNVYKLGGLLSTIGGSGTVEGGSGGTNNYNALVNKPSINNVTLQGNLTSAQLGIEGGSGGTLEMTYEEALAILNEEEGQNE